MDPVAVRLQVKENRKLSSAEVAELVAAYEAGASQRELTAAQEDEVVRCYIQETWTLVQLVGHFKLG